MEATPGDVLRELAQLVYHLATVLDAVGDPTDRTSVRLVRGQALALADQLDALARDFPGESERDEASSAKPAGAEPVLHARRPVTH